MADPVALNKIVVEYELLDNTYPYTVTLFANLIADGTPLSATDTNTGVTFTNLPDFIEDMADTASWSIDN